MITFRKVIAGGITASQRRNKFLKGVIEEIIAGKPSYHRAMGSTLCTILTALEEKGIEYVLVASPGNGYMVQAKPFNDARSALTDTER